MTDTHFMGYTIHRNSKHFLPSTVLFSNASTSITVAMANDAIDYVLSVLAHKNPWIDSYKKAKTVFSAIKMFLNNQQPYRLRKEDLKTTVDVLEEIQNASATSDAEKDYNARCALFCKLMIDGFYEDIS